MSSPVAWIRIFESEIDQIIEATAGSPDLETGGELLGLWSHADMPTVMLAGVTVMLAGSPGPDSKRGTTWFEQDPAAHMNLERLAWERYGVQVVGLWHSHHQLGLHELSAGDVRRTQGYSRRHKRSHYSEILAFLPEHQASWYKSRRDPEVGLRPYLYQDAASGRAMATGLEVLPGESPLRTALRQHNLPPTYSRSLWGPGSDAVPPGSTPSSARSTHDPDRTPASRPPSNRRRTTPPSRRWPRSATT